MQTIKNNFMGMNHAYIAELQMEAANTRKMLAVVPTDKNDFTPHEHSMNLGRLSTHVAELPSWVSFTMAADELDLAKMEYKPTLATSTEELLAKHDAAVAQAIASLESATDEDLHKMWTLRRGDHVVFTLPKMVVLRSMAYNHIYHHRGQLSVYLRLLGVAFPGMYGPSYDDSVAAKAAAMAASN